MRIFAFKVIFMSAVAARKRPVNLTLNEDVIAQARAMTPNLSAVVETLLSGYIAQKLSEQSIRQQQAARVADMWNDFNEQSASFADEYSTL